MDTFDGISVKRATQKEILALLNSTPKDGKMTAQFSGIPEFFADTAYRHDGKLLFIHRHRQDEYYVPVSESERIHAENLARVSSPAYHRAQSAMTRAEKSIRKNVK